MDRVPSIGVLQNIVYSGESGPLLDHYMAKSKRELKWSQMDGVRLA